MVTSSGFEESHGYIYWVVRPALYRRIRMAIETVSDSPAFFVVADLLLPVTIAKKRNNS